MLLTEPDGDVVAVYISLSPFDQVARLAGESCRSGLSLLVGDEREAGLKEKAAVGRCRNGR
jgi:hypothetical protein